MLSAVAGATSRIRVATGGSSDAALRRALRFGTAWHGSGDPEAVAAIGTRIARLAEDVGRDPATLDLTVVAMLLPPGFELAGKSPGRLLGGERPSRDSVVDELGHLAEVGVSTCSLWAPVEAAALPDVLEWAADLA